MPIIKFNDQFIRSSEICVVLQFQRFWMELHVFFCGRTLTINVSLSQSRSFVLYGNVSQQSYVGPDCFIVHDVFLSVFWWIYCYN